VSQSIPPYEISRQTSIAGISIAGIGLDFENIAGTLGVKPTKTHRTGDFDKFGKEYSHDVWTVESPLDPTDIPNAHLEWFGKLLAPHRQWVRSLTGRATIKIYCEIRSRTDQCGFEVAPEVLSMFVELQIPLDGSVSME
jgi:hypothetical protein